MCQTEAESALRALQVSRLRKLIKMALTVSGVLFVCVGLDALFLEDRIVAAPSYRFIFGWATVSWWRWIAHGWGVVFTVSGILLVLAGTKYPEKLRQAIFLGILLTSWWATGLAVEGVWSEFTHRGELPTLYPLFSWAAWAAQFILMNQIPRVAPVAEDEWHQHFRDHDGIVPPTQQDVDRAMHGDPEP
jgi:hypothetical protein